MQTVAGYFLLQPQQAGAGWTAQVVLRMCQQAAAHAPQGEGSETGNGSPPRLQDLVKKGDFAAVKKNSSLINARNRQYLLALAVRDFKSAPKKPSHIELVKFLIQLGAKPDYQLVCAATVGPHIEIMNALIEAGAEQNIFTAAALGEVDRVRDLLSHRSNTGRQNDGYCF